LIRLVVEDTFLIKGRGLLIAPEVDLGDRIQVHVDVELERPDGTRVKTTALAQIPFFVPARKSHHVLQLQLAKEEVPIGTVIWISPAS
jgi:hypothetical protein